MFAGMMVGAVGWGTCSDLVGRSAAFNATLFFTALFGILASLANSFWSLCVLLFFLGSAVGVGLPSCHGLHFLIGLSRVPCLQMAHSFSSTCQRENNTWLLHSLYSSLSDPSSQHSLPFLFFPDVPVHKSNLAVPPLKIMAGSMCSSVLASS